MLVKYVRNGETFSVDTESLPPKSIEYLLQYGFSQSLQDCIAGREKKVKDELAEKAPDAADDEIASAVASDISGTLQKRLDAIVAGTVGVRVAGEAKDPLLAVARDMIRKAIAKAGKKLDMKNEAHKAAFDKLVSDLLAEKRAVVEAEKKRRDEAADIELEF